MDLSNLSSNLPPSTPVTKKELQELESRLANEFKNAANSVASLYRLSNSKNSLLRHEGYLDCLDDLLNLIRLKRVGNSEVHDPEDEYDVFDIENWCLTRKAELLGGENINDGLLFSKKSKSASNCNKITLNEEASLHKKDRDSFSEERTQGLKDEEQDDDEPMDYNMARQGKYEFKMNLPTSHKFRPSKPLLSMEHNRRSNSMNGSTSVCHLRGTKMINGNELTDKQLQTFPDKTVKNYHRNDKIAEREEVQDEEEDDDESEMEDGINGELFKRQRID